MNEKIDRVLKALRFDAAQAAESKLGRRLSAEEQDALGRVHSMLMLEAIYRWYSHETATPEMIAADLAQLSRGEPSG